MDGIGGCHHDKVARRHGIDGCPAGGEQCGGKRHKRTVVGQISCYGQHAVPIHKEIGAVQAFVRTYQFVAVLKSGSKFRMSDSCQPFVGGAEIDGFRSGSVGRAECPEENV